MRKERQREGNSLESYENESKEEYKRRRRDGRYALEDNGEKKMNVDEARNADEKLRGQAERRERKCNTKKRKKEKGCSVEERNESLVNEGEV